MQSKSQVAQDLFAMSHAKHKTYVEIGANHPINLSNTYELEQQGWAGLSYDISPDFEEIWQMTRKNPLVVIDAAKVEWAELTKTNPEMDYMSFDVDENARRVFDAFPWDMIRFRAMTIEHDRYRFGDEFRNHQRQVFSALGYTLEYPDVKCNGLEFEDWWVGSLVTNKNG